MTKDPPCQRGVVFCEMLLLPPISNVLDARLVYRQRAMSTPRPDLSALPATPRPAPRTAGVGGGLASDEELAALASKMRDVMVYAIGAQREIPDASETVAIAIFHEMLSEMRSEQPLLVEARRV